MCYAQDFLPSFVILSRNPIQIRDLKLILKFSFPPISIILFYFLMLTSILLLISVFSFYSIFNS